MKVGKWILNQIGLGDQRQKPPPHYQAITEGVLVTSTKAEAWLTLQTSNTDHISDEEMLDSLNSVITSAGEVLEGVDCHLKVVWGRVSGQDYLDASEHLIRGGVGNGRLLFEERAARIETLEMPERHLLLGVQIADRESEAVATAKKAAGDWSGLGGNNVTDAQLLGYFGRARQLQQSLSNSVWRARMATAEEISWALGRESQRNKSAVARQGTIRGASLFELTSGKIIPHEDFLEYKDEMGGTAAYGAILTMSDFPDEMTVPGNGEWLKRISQITRIEESEDEARAGRSISVVPDASVRFRIIPKGKAIKMAEEARKSAKEQRRSAARHSAGEVPPDIEESEEAAEEAVYATKRLGMRMVEQHPRLIVKAATLDELDADVNAVIQDYAGIGISVVRGVDEQRELFLESLMGDSLRVVDLGHVQDDVAFFGAFWWGGSRVGDDVGPVSGFQTGTTPGLHRSNLVRTASLGIRTTNVFIGSSGMGKSNSIEIELLNSAVLGPEAFYSRERLEKMGPLHEFGVRQYLLDTKGDMSGIVDAARRYDIPAELLRVTDRYAGAADLFRSMDDPFEAAQGVAASLTLLAPPNMASFADEATLEAATMVAEQPNPTTFAVVEYLVNHQDDAFASLGRHLSRLGQSGLGKLVLGEFGGRTLFRNGPGIWLYQFPGLSMPSSEKPLAEWNPKQRLSVTLLRGILAHLTHMSGDQKIRTSPKNIVVPEVHSLLKISDGVEFLDVTARVGRAFNTGLTLDTQDAEGISRLPGLVEQLANVRIFQLTSQPQIEAAAMLLQKDPASIGATIRTLGVDLSSPDGVRKGHCLSLDPRQQVGTIQYDFPNQEVADLLNTNADQMRAGDDVDRDESDEQMEMVS